MKRTTLIATGIVALAATLAGADSAMTDANIGAIVVAANQIDIDYGKIAMRKAKSKEVKDFAQHMVTDHRAVLQSVIALAGKLNLVPKPDATSETLQKNAVEVTKKLQALSGADFDRFYVDNEVAYHTQVTQAVASVLIPQAHNQELKAALTGAQSLFLGHLDHSKQLQAGFAHTTH